MLSTALRRVRWGATTLPLAVLALAPFGAHAVDRASARTTGVLPAKPLVRDMAPPPAAGDANSLPAQVFEGPPITGEKARRVTEGEELVRAGHVHVRAARISTQDMSSFGGGWSGNAQLFLAASGKGARLLLELYTAGPAWHSVDVYFTRAPDYGRLALKLEGGAREMVFDGYAPHVEAAEVLHVGGARPDQGRLLLDVRVTGKNRRSRGYLAGIDRIVLTPRAEPP